MNRGGMFIGAVSQQTGLSVHTIRFYEAEGMLLVLRDRSTDACSHVRSLVQEKLTTVHEKLKGLGAMEKELKLVLVECNRQLKRHRPGRGERCPVL
jgi:DNA-binding transcriptional MerR regulator